MSIKPYARPSVSDADIEAVVEVLKSQFLTTGPKIPQFEKLFAQKVDATDAVACSNGTAALHLASMALGLKPGDKVIVPALTFLATANAVRMCGADVIFSDVDGDTGIMTLENLKEAETRAGEGVVAVYPVHIGGHCADMKEISTYARSKGWKMVEDACHALGSTNHGAMVGACAYSDMACFSLHATKSFTSCEGGMITSNDPIYAERMRRFRNHGMDRDGEMRHPDLALDENGEKNPWYYEMAELGYNYRLTDVHAALGIAQISRLSDVAKRRGEIVERYRTALSACSDLMKPVAPTNKGEPLLHLFQVLIDFEKLGKSRAVVCKELMAQDVGTQVHYIPVAWQPYYIDLYGKPDLPGAEKFYERVLALPLYTSLTDDEVENIIVSVKSVLS